MSYLQITRESSEQRHERHDAAPQDVRPGDWRAEEYQGSPPRDADPPLNAPDDSRLTRLVAAAETVKQWKAVEDVIDARRCASVALLWDVDGTDDWITTGESTWRDGHIIIPSRASGHPPGRT